MKIEEIEYYTKNILPKIRQNLMEEKDDVKLVELYELYEQILCLIAPYDFDCFNEYIEFDEVKNTETKSFHYHRKKHLSELVTALNDIEIYDKYDLLLISMPPRVGKALPLDEPVLTPTGWVENGELRVGDSVIGYNGDATTVTGVFPQGEKDCYEVIFDDGTSVRCSEDHLWTVQTRDDRVRDKERTVTTKSMLNNLYVEGDSRKNYSINYVEPVDFVDTLTDDDIDPYVLGCILGDGCVSQQGVSFTSKDDEIISEIRCLLPKTDVLNNVSTSDIQYNFVKKDTSLRNERGRHFKCSIESKIFEYGLNGKNSSTKFIPKKYLYSGRETRLALLQGLMDTDGHACHNSYCEYTTVSEQLSIDFIELVRSLGARATVSTKIGSYTKNGIKVECKKVYRIVFNLSSVVPFRLSRKVAVFKPRITRCVKYIKAINYVGKIDCQCISVSCEKHLYVTSGYNLTHNTTYNIRFISWVIGRHPENTQLVTSYSESIVASFYSGVLEILQNDRYKKAFPESRLVNQNAKRLELWLQVMKRYPTVSFIPIEGSMTGRAESGNYLFVDDLVSGIEQAMSPTRLEKLWTTYSVNARQRKKQGCKEIHIATRWSVNDPMSILERQNEDNPRFKSIKLPCFNEDLESNFDFFGGFNTQYYLDQQNSMDEISFNALYMQEPIEREGLLYHKDDLKYYFELPETPPDTIISICDSKNMGKDYVCSIVGYVYGDITYLDAVVYNSGLPEVTRPKVANLWTEHKVVRGDVEMNNGGNYYAEDLQELLKQSGARTSVRTFFSSNNKLVKIITYSDYIKSNFVFRHPSTYAHRSEYSYFMKDVLSFTQTGKNKHDDSVDGLAMLAQLHQDLTGNSVKILDRKRLGL